MTSIPAGPRELTPEWFTTALRLPEKHQIKSIELEALGEKDSVSGYIYRANIHYSQKSRKGPRSVVIKIPRARDQRTPFLLGAYIREVRFYEKLAPKVGIKVPKLIYADLDTETSDYILILEDFPDSTNVRNETGATPTQAFKLLKNMAKLHSTFWGDPKISRLKFLNNLDNIIEVFNTGFPTTVPVFLSRFKQYMESDEIEIIRKLPEYFEDIVSPLLDSPQTLVHNDYAMKNILILDESDDVSFVLVDWANVGQGPGVRDLSFFIGTSIRPEIRFEYESEFLLYYWESLRKTRISGYSFDRLFSDYRRTLIIDLARTVHFGGREYFNSMYESIIRQDIGRRIGSVKELDLPSLTKQSR
jgi:thiamine kinase-like enzyme